MLFAFIAFRVAAAAAVVLLVAAIAVVSREDVRSVLDSSGDANEVARQELKAYVLYQ